jgi:hypothetical protein
MTGRNRFSVITVAAITRARPSRLGPMVTAVAVCKRDYQAGKAGADGPSLLVAVVRSWDSEERET